ncbi:hypothetical protein, partial [Clostridium perfringens]|uniref:hypothetical protein n=1 Tax=Clostridium perfringens TaxID=1502 RepID=UPI003754835D
SLGTIFSLAEALPETSIREQARVMSYINPEARSLGVDVTEASEATGFLEMSGIRGTRAATTLRQMLLGTLHAGGPMNAQLATARDRDEADLE